MKKLLTLTLVSFALSAFAQEPVVQPNGAVKEGTMLLAKKKDHTKDKKVVPTKSPKVAKAKTTKTKIIKK